MTPEINQQRTAAFRAWAASLPDRDAARDELRLSHRTYQRMWSGKQPPPPRLLEEIADRTADRALADRLRAAARNRGPLTEKERAFIRAGKIYCASAPLVPNPHLLPAQYLDIPEGEADA